MPDVVDLQVPVNNKCFGWCSNWYFGPLKHRLAYVVSALRYWPPMFNAEMTYTLACDGCSRCYVPPPKPQWRWWHIFLPPRVEGYLHIITGTHNGPVLFCMLSSIHFVCRLSSVVVYNACVLTLAMQDRSLPESFLDTPLYFWSRGRRQLRHQYSNRVLCNSLNRISCTVENQNAFFLALNARIFAYLLIE